ncbi:MAG TPA: hypothetical protein VEJ18_09800 [Planctomycetota bacterium]|nr:hypothetical protein [Planctomycetota bacterium]
MSLFADLILTPLFNGTYFLLDVVLGWVTMLPAAAAIGVVGALSGVGVMALQKWGSRQELLGRCKADLKLLKQKIRDAKRAGDASALNRYRGLQSRIGGKYLAAALKPALLSVPLIGLVGLWTGSRLGFLPVRPDGELTVVAHFEDAASGYAHVVPDAAMAVVGPVLSSVEVPAGAAGKQARWTVRPTAEGRSAVVVRHAGATYRVPLPVARRGGRPPDPVTVFSRGTPGQDRLQAVELRLADSLPPAWWNLKLQWGGLYLLVALLVALPLRWIMKIQ